MASHFARQYSVTTDSVQFRISRGFPGKSSTEKQGPP